ncbi:MAG: 5'-methylthioadenosine/S-adenosylhomocysteine nucleosidase [Treponema sp.]|jgi:adenosylhomocysteine nucleosidase|nr:5'-methylthioadenosine/S-adenosylhomocysteine nucleosidase [Treponema sp.]
MIGIIGAMEEEIVLLRSYLEEPRKETVSGFEFLTGRLEGKAVVLLRCGIGKVNAAVGSGLLLDRFKPDFVVNTGSAGGIDPSLSFGDAVISTGLIQHDVDVTGFNYAPGQVPGMPLIFPVAKNLVELAEKAITALKQEGILPSDFNYTHGVIGTGDVFMHEPERIAIVRNRFPCIRAIDMEAAAIAQTCYLFKAPYLIIRALSDIVGVESPFTFDKFLPIAAKNSAEIVRKLIAIMDDV